ncbi:TetR/AcrR family transcriptional regulator [Archangium minus]|uniref:TetR/AcrR family transcriptional regulator n=1 Tax=Archangium minus TaxID=83450 RepID=A0ABY9WZR9_9BACT|nr:TetR/AcrR family transcriptional regulator [Archangium minus]
MAGARKTGASKRAASHGRIDKREAILEAAFTVFARQGYAQACVNEIAAEAGVAKPTVYNHLTDKANLFRHAMEAAAERALAADLAAIERLADRGNDDLRAALEDVGYRLLRAHDDARAWALRRLLYAEIVRDPELLDIVRGRGANRVTESLADRLARLSLAGLLRVREPVEAAEQLLALLTGPLESRSRLGTRHVPDTELRGLARAAVNTFLLAFGASPEQAHAP